MSAYELNLFLHRLSVEPAFREGIRADDDAAWASIDLDADERAAFAAADIAWLYDHGANDFLLHNMFRFGIGGIDIDSYVRGIRAHLAGSEASSTSAPPFVGSGGTAP